MSSGDLERLEVELTRSMSSYDWPETEKFCQQIIQEVNKDPGVFPEPNAKRLLGKLRRKRRYQLMSKLAEAILRSGQNHPQVRRQYAQSLIDQDILTAAEFVLNAIINDPSVPKGEEIEARGLTGRIYKQLYVNAVGGDKTKNQRYFQLAVEAYLSGYTIDPAENFWHGINVVALLKRGRRDGLSLQDMPDADKMAADILDVLNAKIENSADTPGAWILATVLEAQIALGQREAAVKTALDYSLCEDGDAFEYNSTIRQLTEVWQLDDKEPPGDEILPILRSALLRREGGQIELVHGESALEVEKIKGLEGVFGVDKTVPLRWYRTGLERSNSVARIELLNGKGHGTGWLVKREDFFPGSTGLLLVTNAHVVSNNPSDYGLPPNQVQANFQGMGQVFEIDEIIWSSPQTALDATFVSLKGEPPPELKPLPVEAVTIRMGDPPPRFYIIGHPGGRDLEFSIHDNHLVAANDTLLHYRTPTEGGSSGSPVFEQFGWKVVALHHKGLSQMPRIDNQPGTYEANEGVTVRAIKNAISNGNGH